jgi:hypothetical protein
VLDNIQRLKDKAKDGPLSLDEQRELDHHEKVLAHTRVKNLEKEQQVIRSLPQPRELDPVKAQALEEARAVLQRPVPGAPTQASSPPLIPDNTTLSIPGSGQQAPEQASRKLPEAAENIKALDGIPRLKEKAEAGELSPEEKRELDQYEKTRAATRVYHLETEQQALSKLNPPRELNPVKAQALENERAILQRPVPESGANTPQQSTGEQNPYREPNGTLIIPERTSSSSDPALAEHEKKLQDIANNQPRADKLYNDIPDAKGGKVIGTDIARELLPEFTESREGKINYTNATGRVSAAYAKDRLWREIENPQGRTKLMFTAGGVAAGKSTAVTDEMVDASDLVFDGTLRETDWAIKTIEHAIAKGWRVEINYVQRPLPLVLQGAIDRAQSKGRWGSLADLPAIHQAAQQSIIEIAKHFEGHPGFALNILLNEGKTLSDPPKELTLKQIDAGGEYSYHEKENDVSRLDRTGTQGTAGNPPAKFRQEGAETARRIFEEAVRSGMYEPRVLRLLAKGNPELEALVPPAGSNDPSN